MGGKMVLEITMAELLESSDWGEVFGEGDGGNCNDVTEACIPGDDIDLAPPKRSDVAEIIAAVNGMNEEDDWVGVFRLKDGRYLVATGGCDYTGWDCRAFNSLQVARTLGGAMFAISPYNRGRLGLPLEEIA